MIRINKPTWFKAGRIFLLRLQDTNNEFQVQKGRYNMFSFLLMIDLNILSWVSLFVSCNPTGYILF